MQLNPVKLVASILLIAHFQSSPGQTNYVPGYVLHFSGEKVEGLIDYRNWEKNPSSIQFKEGLPSRPVIYTATDIQQFGVADETYRSASVEMEVSPVKTYQLSNNPELKMERATVFLQEMIRGPKSLYHLKDGNHKDHFYIQHADTLQLLIYKRYLKTQATNRAAAENNTYKGQLIYYLNDCPSIKRITENIKYQKESLEKVFQSYYRCTGETITQQKKTEKIITEFGVLAGASLSTLRFSSNNNADGFFRYLIKPDFGQSINPAGGFYFELILPRNLNKWSFNTELMYTSYTVAGSYSEVRNPEDYYSITTTLDYTYLKLNNMFRFRQPAGDMRLFFNVGVSTGFAIQANSYGQKGGQVYSSFFTNKLEVPAGDRDFELGLLAGIGARYKAFSLELRHERGNGMSNFINMRSTSIRTYVLLGYRF